MNPTPTTYRVGVATCDITPPIGTHMAGFGSRTQPSEGAYRPLSATVTIINDGETTLLGAGGAMAAEMTADYGLRLRRELGGSFARVLPMGYANDIVGYIGSLRQKREGGYEGWSANYYWFRTGPWEDDTEERIVATIRHSLDV